MMPAISLTPLPPIPPFQFMPEPDLNFEAVLEAVPVAVPTVPAQPEPLEPNEALLNFLGINPVKGQAIAPESPVLEEEVLDEDEISISTDLFSREGGSPAPIIDSFGLGTGLPPSRENREGLGTAVPQQVPNTPPPQPFGLAPSGSLSKPRLSSDVEEKDSTSTSSVRTDLGAVPFSITSPSLGDVKELSPPLPTTNIPTADPLRFIVERQLDLVRDSRWLDALARDIVAVAETPDRLSFRLHPPQLGRLDVDLSTTESGLSVRMNTSTEAATQIVAAAQPRLIDELKSQGLRVAEAQVSTSSGGQSHGQGQQQQQRDADQMIEYARARFERAAETNQTRPMGRFA